MLNSEGLNQAIILQEKLQENSTAQKGVASLRIMFLIFVILVFGFFFLDISLTSVVLGQTITAVINLIPLITL
jgi:hypothetical protein